MPPYLIGMESVTPNPFSASSRTVCTLLSRQKSDLSPEIEECSTFGLTRARSRTGSGEYVNGYSPNPTCWEVLTVRLGQFASKMVKHGIVITDEMLQAEARQIVYDSDDSWNQTAADNPEWLDLFKKAHGLDFIPSAIGGQGERIPEDLETFGDLGLRIPFAVKLKIYNQRQHDESQEVVSTADVPATNSHVRSEDSELRELYVQLTRDGLLHPSDYSCGHVRCEYNVVDVSTVEDSKVSPMPVLDPSSNLLYAVQGADNCT